VPAHIRNPNFDAIACKMFRGFLLTAAMLRHTMHNLQHGPRIFCPALSQKQFHTVMTLKVASINNH
jgi:hypothetical protein